MAFEKDTRLVARMIAGEAGAVEEFIAEYRSLVYAILTRYLKLSPEDAGEVFQRFLVHIWEDDYRRLLNWRKKTRLAVYLAKIVRNLAEDYRRERRFLLQDPPDEPVEDAGLQSVEKRAVLEAALRKLSSRDRELIHRRLLLEESYEEIGRALGMTPNSAGVALSRARTRLKQILRKKM